MNWVSPEEFARIFTIDRRTVYNLIRKKQLKFPVKRIGGQYRIDISEGNDESNSGNSLLQRS